MVCHERHARLDALCEQRAIGAVPLQRIPRRRSVARPLKRAVGVWAPGEGVRAQQVRHGEDAVLPAGLPGSQRTLAESRVVGLHPIFRRRNALRVHEVL